MSEVPTEGNSEDDGETAVTVSVSSNGQATIPKKLREKLGIEAPGHVRFRETEEGLVVVEPVPSVEEMKGFAERTADADIDAPASELLREKRERDKRERDGE